MTKPNEPAKGWWAAAFDVVKDPRLFISIIGLAAMGALGYGIYSGGGKFLESLQHTEIARGLITFLVAGATVSIAIILALYAVVSSSAEDLKDRFTLGKEILTALIGILGTIIGFYFGSAVKAEVRLDVAEVKIVDKSLITHVSGGTKPYRYSIVSDDKDFKSIENRVSEDGWIVQTLEHPIKSGTTITIEVTDSKDQKTSKKLDFAALGKQDASPPGTISPSVNTPPPKGAPGK